MKKSIFVFLPLSILSAFFTGCTEDHIPEIPNKEKAVELLKSLETGAAAPVEFINPNKYIQHNLLVPDGVQGFINFQKYAQTIQEKVNIVRVFQDDDLVFLHSEYKTSLSNKIGFDIFRFENGKIVEHWDNGQNKESVNSSGHSMIDGAFEVNDHSRTIANKALVINYLNDVSVKGDVDKIDKYLDGGKLIQHDPFIADGASRLKDAITAWKNQGIVVTYDKIHRILGDGNFVLALGEGNFNGKHIAYYDLFRLQHHKIVEHWDVQQEIPPKESWKNNNGKF